MVPVYAVFTTLGVLALLAWIGLGLAASAWSGREAWDPEDRFGQRGRDTVAAVLGFGLAGMSASFGGWSTPLAAVGAVAGGVAAVFVGRYLGVEDDPDGDAA